MLGLKPNQDMQGTKPTQQQQYGRIPAVHEKAFKTTEKYPHNIPRKH